MFIFLPCKLAPYYVYSLYISNKKNEAWGESTLKWDMIMSHCIIFLRVPCLNFNHVIIMKDFHNVFVYYGKSELK
jgi:hypothetical protein